MNGNSVFVTSISPIDFVSATLPRIAIIPAMLVRQNILRFLVLLLLAAGGVLSWVVPAQARNLRMMYFDVFVGGRLKSLTGEREMLTGAMSEGLVSLDGLDILDRAARDATWKSRKLLVSECEKLTCRLESAKALSMELMLEAEIKPLGKRCLVRLTIKDVRKNGMFQTNMSHKTACKLEGLMGLLKNMAASAWPPERAKKWKPPVRRKRLLGRSEERRVGKECRSRWSPYH